MSKPPIDKWNNSTELLKPLEDLAEGLGKLFGLITEAKKEDLERLVLQLAIMKERQDAKKTTKEKKDA